MKVDDFWRYVSIPSADACWVWQRARLAARGGYGTLHLDGDRKHLYYAHRVAYKIHFGEIQEGASVLHKCDNPPCVNPAHLFLGTPQDNMADKVSKGRQARGVRHGQALLTPRLVLAIRAAHATGLVTKSRLAEICEVSRTVVDALLARRTWAHVS